MTRPAATTGNHPLPASHGVTQYYANSIPLPAGSIIRPQPVLERGYVYQALLDVSALLINLLIIGALIGSLPLAILLMVLGSF